LLVCDHASAAIPRRPVISGVAVRERQTHIAYDIGAAAVAAAAGGALRCATAAQRASRAW